MINILFLIIACLGYSVNALATVFISMDFENGGSVPYYSYANKAPGGGYISYLGGVTTHPYNPGDGTQDYATYNNVVIDNSADAKNSITGSNYSLKTQYMPGYINSYQLNTTNIDFPNTRNVYVRWYQKWSSVFEWPTQQQKLLKHIGNGVHGDTLLGGSNYIKLQKINAPPYQYDYISVYSDPENLYLGHIAMDDSIPDNQNYHFNKNQWYCIESQYVGSDYATSNGRLTVKVNDSVILDLRNTFNFVAGADGVYPNWNNYPAGYYYEVQMQHLIQESSLGDYPDHPIPTWMDNVVVSDQPIGCSGTSPPQVALPKPPTVQ